MFIVAAVQHIKIGDLTTHPSGLQYPSEDEDMQVDQNHDQHPNTTTPVLSKGEERSLVRDSTAGFAGRLPFSVCNCCI